jgi:dihydroceramidase
MACSGFWGPVTSSVDWCEANYAHSRFICEWFNTFSSLAMLAAGTAGFALHRREPAVDKRFLLAFGLVVLVGVGSVAFHATLRFRFQMLDEVPMLYVALVVVYALVENRPQRRFGLTFQAALVLWGLILTALSTLTRGRVQFIAFQASFGSLELYALAAMVRTARTTTSAPVRRLLHAGLAIYVLGILFWLTDLRWCRVLQHLGPLPNPQLHAWWHVLASWGLYLVILALAGARAHTLGFSPRLERRFGIPRLRGEARVNL